LTDEGEKAEDLVDPDDYKTLAVLLNTEESKEKDRRMSAVRGIKKEPAWFRRESIQRESVVEMPKPTFHPDERKHEVRVDIKHSENNSFSALRARKGSMWVGGEGSKVVEEDEEILDTVSDSHLEESEENVSAKLEQWKRRRVERLER
jgi:hypothetical protein